METTKYIYDTLEKMFPNAQCELNYHNMFELIVCVVLSAQATDVSVNKATPKLFEKYKDPYLLKDANIEDVKEIIKTIGLAQTKAKNIIALSNKLVSNFDGNVPSDIDSLMSLPGVGRKTANVVLAEGFKIPRIAVDTHVFRVSHRLGLSSGEDPLKVEEDLMKIFPSEWWCDLHIRLLFFGRYCCTARNPKCENCPFISFCTK